MEPVTAGGWALGSLVLQAAGGLNLIDAALTGLVGNRADAGISRGFLWKGVGKVVENLHLLKSAEKDVLWRRLAISHAQAVVQIAILFARNRGYEIATTLGALTAPGWIAAKRESVRGRELTVALGVLRIGWSHCYAATIASADR